MVYGVKCKVYEMPMEKKKAIVKYKKSDLRKTLERNMKTTVTAKEFARWFGIYCDMKSKSDEIRNAKELPKAEVDELAEWMGYALIE